MGGRGVRPCVGRERKPAPPVGDLSQRVQQIARRAREAVEARHAAPEWSSAASFPDREFFAKARHLAVARKVALFDGGDPGFDLFDLPSVEREVILDGFGHEPVARALGSLGEPVERPERRLRTVKAADIEALISG